MRASRISVRSFTSSEGSGSGAGAGAGFVLYTSADGIAWDEGVSLDTLKPACYYSNNIVVREPGKPDRMLIQFSELYRLHMEDACVNVMHAWLDSIK